MTPAGNTLEARPVMAIDVGSTRIGLAVSDPTRTIATPVATVARNSPDVWRLMTEHVQEHDAALAVVGLPRLLDGSEGDAAADARCFAAEFQQKIGVTVELWDERFTTALAERSLIEAGMRRQRRKATVDAVAATLILQSWLDAHNKRS